MPQSYEPAALAEMAAFAAIAEARSFTRAAVRVGRDATILSRRLQSLEERLGVRLLHRTTRSVSLTEAGAEFLVRVRAILASVDEAEAAIFGYTLVNDWVARDSNGDPAHVAEGLPVSLGPCGRASM